MDSPLRTQPTHLAVITYAITTYSVSDLAMFSPLITHHPQTPLLLASLTPAHFPASHPWMVYFSIPLPDRLFFHALLFLVSALHYLVSFLCRFYRYLGILSYFFGFITLLPGNFRITMVLFNGNRFYVLAFVTQSNPARKIMLLHVHVCIIIEPFFSFKYPGFPPRIVSVSVSVCKNVARTRTRTWVQSFVVLVEFGEHSKVCVWAYPTHITTHPTLRFPAARCI